MKSSSGSHGLRVAGLGLPCTRPGQPRGQARNHRPAGRLHPGMRRLSGLLARQLRHAGEERRRRSTQLHHAPRQRGGSYEINGVSQSSTGGGTRDARSVAVAIPSSTVSMNGSRVDDTEPSLRARRNAGDSASVARSVSDAIMVVVMAEYSVAMAVFPARLEPYDGEARQRRRRQLSV